MPPAATGGALGPWLDWLADNRLRGCSSASMLAALQQAGLEDGAAAALLTRFDSAPETATLRRLIGQMRKQQALLAHQMRLWAMAPDALQLPRRAHIDRDSLLREHVAASRPLLLTGLAADWPALRRWTPQQLADRHGEVWVEVQAGRSRDPDYERHKLALRQRMPLRELVARVLAGAGNDLYLTANNEALKQPELAPLLADIGRLPDWLDRAALPGASMLWLGGAGVFTPNHHDTLMLLHTQITGRKRWWLCPPWAGPRLYNTHGVFSPVDLAAPDPQRHPDALGLPVIECVLEPGDTLFLPLGWWHQVQVLETGVSLSFTNLAFDNHFDFPAPEAWP